jgi:putative sterol carrier protein
VPRFYSPEWVAAFNEAVGGLDPASVDTTGALRVSDGRFRVSQLVHGGPDGELEVTLVADDGRLHLEVRAPTTADNPPAERPEVTISLSYDDAAAMSRGELDPADALGRGRVRVRGDLALLVAGQSMLAAAAERLVDLQTNTTY